MNEHSGQLLEGDMISRKEWLVLLCVVAIGAALRLHHLGVLSFYGDEETSALAVIGLLADGFPHMPSGLEYWRGLPYSYAAAGSAAVLGVNELAIRLPSAIFGTLTIPLLFLFVRRTLGALPAVISTCLLTVSAWHIMFSQLGRMYAMFAFGFLLSMYLIYRVLYEDARKYTGPAVLAAVFTMALHELGILLVLVWAVALLLRYLNGRVNGPLTYWSPLLLAGIWLGYHQVNSVVANRAPDDMVPAGNPAEVLPELLGTLHLTMAPKFWSLSYMVSESPFAVVGLACITAALTMYAWRSYGKPNGLGRAIGWGSAGFLGLALANLFGLVAVGLFAAVIVGRRQCVQLLQNRFVQVVSIEVLALFCIWIAIGLFVWKGEGLGSLETGELVRKVIKDSTYYPALHVLVFFTAFPIMSSLAFAGSAWWLSGYATRARSAASPEDFVFLSFWASLIVLGFTREWLEMRFVLPLYLLFLAIFSWTICSMAVMFLRSAQAGLNLRASGPPPLGFGYGLALATLLVIVPVMNEYHGIEEALAISQSGRGLKTWSDPTKSLKERPDHKTAGQYVRANLRRGDIVVAMDVLQQFYYVGRVDYWLRERSDAAAYSHWREGKYYDIYTNTQVLASQDELVFLLRHMDGARIWIITSAELTGRQARFIPPGVNELLVKMNGHLVFTGRDNVTSVYLLEPPKSPG